MENHDTLYIEAARSLSRQFPSYYAVVTPGLFDTPPVLRVQHKSDPARRHEMICQPQTFSLNLEFLKGRLGLD